MLVLLGHFIQSFQLIKFYNSPMQWANTVIISTLLMGNLRVNLVQVKQDPGPQSHSEKEI